MKITDTIKYVGVNDHQVDLFEVQYAVPNGMAYNSYVILDDKVAVMDTVDANFKHEWLDNLEQALGGRKPDYLIVQQMDLVSSVLWMWKKTGMMKQEDTLSVLLVNMAHRYRDF